MKNKNINTVAGLRRNLQVLNLKLSKKDDSYTIREYYPESNSWHPIADCRSEMLTHPFSFDDVVEFLEEARN